MSAKFLVPLVLYSVLLFAAGLRFPRGMKSLDDFFLAGRGLSAARIAFSLSASWVGAASILVSMDEACRSGLSAFWTIGLPAVVTLLILALLVGAVRRLPEVTLPEMMEARYGRAVRHMTSALVIWYMTVFAASQMVALGTFLKTFLGLTYPAGLALVAATVFLYSSAGGLMSVVKTHVLQLFLLAAGLAILLAVLLGRSSPEEVRAAASMLGKTGYFSFFHDLGKNTLVALSFILAWTVSPIAWQRVKAARSEAAAKQGVLAAAGLLAAIYLGIVFIGLLFLPVYPSGTPGGGSLIPEFMAAGAGPFLSPLLFLAVLAAIFSTLDAALNAGAFSLARDVIQEIAPQLRLRRAIASGRLSTILVGAAALAVAAQFEDILKTLGLASEIMAGGLFLPWAAALFLKRRIPLAGLAALAGGGGYALLSFLDQVRLVRIGLPSWPASLLPGLALSLSGFLLGALLEKVAIRRG